ncbi:hypothetical protein [Massilia sp. Root335]|uniref:hypothetical protein n=1 Tax=Massilia sp. Root335 TaxID=1736517 RepID=UPI0012F6CE24|nr:hypothetical protein [Massilia sp. Root335]
MQILPVCTGSNDMLVSNIEVACYQAQRCPDPRTDALSTERAAWEAAFDTLPGHQMECRNIRAFMIKNRSISESAMKSGNKKEQLDELIELLDAYLLGVQRVSDINHPSNIDIVLDSQFGPLIFPSRLLRRRSERPSMDVRVLGLIFNLTYLFRFFSGVTSTRHNSTLLLDERLIIDGPMLRKGQPQYRYVAALVNCVFGSKYNARDVKEKLSDLPRDTIWGGWPAPYEVSGEREKDTSYLSPPPL